MHALQTNYYFRISVIHYPRLQTTLMLTPPKQHKFQILSQNKEAKRELVEQETNLYYHFILIQANMVCILNVTKSLRWFQI